MAWDLESEHVKRILPELARKRMAQQAAVIAKAVARMAALSATFESGNVANSTKAAISLNRRLSTQRGYANDAYAIYRGWNSLVCMHADVTSPVLWLAGQLRARWRGSMQSELQVFAEIAAAQNELANC